MFKVGDRVRAVSDIVCSAGSTGTVTNPDNNGYIDVEMDEPYCGEDNYLLFLDGELEFEDSSEKSNSEIDILNILEGSRL